VENVPGPTAALLRLLVGTWAGTGRGSFPTIEPFRYREVLTFAPHVLEPRLQYEQRTWRISDGPGAGGAGEPLHHELGFLLLCEDGSIEVANTQGSGRVEVLEGRLEEEPDGFSLALRSRVLANDERMVATTRSLRVRPAELVYEAAMTTDRVEVHTLHLEARLERA
jgi:hypothetical protein